MSKLSLVDGETPPRKTDEQFVQDGARRIVEAVPDIVAGVIEQAKKGSYLHAKFLFEFAHIELHPAEAPEEEDSFAALLLEKLGAPPEKIAEIAGRQTAVT
jgi:hypothetical protein